MKNAVNILVALVLALCPTWARASDARLSYKTSSGQYASVLATAPTCGVQSDGTPLLCTASGTAGTTDARMAYRLPNGQYQSVMPTVPVCSVDSSGVPQICSTPDLSSYLTATIAAETYSQLSGGNSFLGEQRFASVYFADPDNNVSRDAKFGDKGIAVSGGTKTDTLSVTTSAYVPDTTTTDSTTAALNTESAAARFVSQTTAASTYATVAALNTQVNNAAATYETITGMSKYALVTDGTLTTPTITKPSIDDGTLTTDGKGNWILSGNNGIQFGGAEWLNYNATDGYIAVNGDLEITGRVNLPTRTTGDDGNYAASTAFVQNTINAMQGSVTGDLSASGSSLSLALGSSGLTLTMAYSASATGSLSIVSTSGSITPVDIYETAAWGTTSFKGYTLDGGTVTTTATVIDSTFYLSSNAWGTYHIGVGGNLYVVDIFGSGAGKRTVISWRKIL
ncbi:hypothetical protein [Novacetimonas hansenii]|uniref:hypothetical protein n=1 Tax=Novacetimonas hansenii TaxID=436 RepID=UPI000A9E74F9|nr:hypothetical protein [Novacetimonas hansenii]